MKTEAAKRAVIYSRVSSDEQRDEGYSLDSQQKALRRIAIQKNFSIAREFEESYSARKPGRVIFNEMVSFVRDNKIDAILCYKPDRLSRNHIDLYIIKELIKENGVELAFVEGIFDPSPQGMFGLDMLISMASFQVENQAKDIKRGLLEKAQQGIWPLRAPIGYRNDRNTRALAIDEVSSFYVVQAFQLYSTGQYSVRTLAKKLYEMGFRNRNGNKVWSHGVETILKNPLYYGLMKYGGKYYQGKHAALIPKELFDQVQKRLSCPNQAKKKGSRDFALKGPLVCDECGCMITAEIKKEKYVYYHCTNSKGGCLQKRYYLKEEHLTDQIGYVLESFRINDSIAEIVLEAAREAEAAKTENLETIRKNLETSLTKAKAKEKALLDKYIDGHISSDELYAAKASELSSERTTIEHQLCNLDKDDTSTLELMERVLDVAKTAGKAFVNGEAAKKRKILQTVASNFSIRHGEIVSYQLKGPFEMISKWPKTDDIQLLWR